jgi:Zn-dependent peptidase ImmA (M78 family)/O-acetyl-ADP-ribose deacetylase (regulator of RNase III)
MRLNLPKTWYEKSSPTDDLLDITTGTSSEHSSKSISKIPEWTHTSVVRFSQGSNPIELMIARAQQVTLEAQENGWTGPPFDPIALAKLFDLRTKPSKDVAEARLLVSPESDFLIEYNPNHTRSRTKFSVAHEIAHTFFPDWQESVRNRLRHNEMVDDDWQLEMLCNIGAAEILMPAGSLGGLNDLPLSIDTIVELQRKYEVSTEAVLLRFAHLHTKAFAVFVASFDEKAGKSRYVIDYSVPSRAWKIEIPRRLALPAASVISECIAIGYTAKGEEHWPSITGSCKIECIGIPPFPGSVLPRVAGIALPTAPVDDPDSKIKYLVGDATKPRSKSRAIIAHIVNDRAPRWGAGFASVIRREWPEVQDDFVRWTAQNRQLFKLGNVHRFDVSDRLTIVQMISQHGYGPSIRSRLRYTALDACLQRLATIALECDATVHMPRIGTGQAGGAWEIVEELLDRHLTSRGISLTVYSLTKPEPSPERPQLSLFQ